MINYLSTVFLCFVAQVFLYCFFFNVGIELYDNPEKVHFAMGMMFLLSFVWPVVIDGVYKIVRG